MKTRQHKTKILHIIKSLGRGGAEMLLPETLKLHDQERFEFHYIYFLPWKDQMVEALKSAGGKVTCLPSKNNIQLMRQIGKVDQYVQEHKIDLIHAHLPWAGFLSRFLHKNTQIPVIYTEHNKQERYHKITFWMNKLTFNWQSKAISVSSDVETSIRKHIKPKVKVQTVLNGVNTDFFERKSFSQLAQEIPNLKENKEKNTFQMNQGGDKILPFDNGNEVLQNLLKQKQDNPNIQVVGTIVVFRFQKRLVEWVKVFHQAVQSNPNLRGVIVGNGPFAEQLLKLRTELNLEDHLFLPGLQTNTKDWFSMMDIFMMSSEFEGLPIALLEAMSMECAIVSTDAGGVKEVIVEGESGLMVGVDEWLKLADNLGMLRDAELRSKLAKGGRKRVVEAFSLKRMVGELESVYLEYSQRL
ncbi:glycosyltransferase family 4 protein [Marivirga sp.]|uniref:glycosyltransferase family 4 protein n=1 Tax=Marivirga sp. TaxID=2018662 RepID=UPI002D7F4BFB|nr:glycosyltransferase family 4 protein [Marivirga sp.]HET8860570.1 glycosyltransferase family 4 protein [Marivirga sp.]